MTLIDFRSSLYVLMVALLTGMAVAEPEELPSGKEQRVAVEIPKGVLAQLSSEQYGEREKAYSELEKWAAENVEESPEILHGAWRASEEPEAKTRCFTLMKAMVVQRRFGKGKGFVGIRMEEFLAPGKPGEPGKPSVRVSLVLPDTPAARSGLKAGDIVLGVDDLDFTKDVKIGQAQLGQGGAGIIRPGMILGMGTVTKFSNYIQSKQPDDVITLHLLRNGKKSDMKITLMKRPASADADPFGRPQQDERKRESDRFFKSWLKEKGD